MLENKLISIIITTYNRKKYLKKAIDSVFTQSYKHYEIIIIDDCSQDGTFEYIKESYKHCENISIFRNNENLGPGKNRKYALQEKIKGEYIIFLDDDDVFIDSEYFSKAMKLFEKNDKLSMVSCNHIIHNTITNEDIKMNLNYNEIVDNKEFFMNFGNENFKKPIASFTIFKKEAFEKTKSSQMKIFNDTTIFLRALLYGPMGMVNTFGGVYLIHGKNISFGCDCDFILDNLNEKYSVYKLANKFFKVSEKEMKQWLREQSDITIIYYIKGSKPNKKSLKRIYFWAYIHLRSMEYIKKYKEIGKECEKKDKRI